MQKTFLSLWLTILGLISGVEGHTQQQADIVSYQLDLRFSFNGESPAENILRGQAIITFVATEPGTEVYLLLNRLLTADKVTDDAGNLLPMVQQVKGIEEWEDFKVNEIVVEMITTIKDTVSITVYYHGALGSCEASGMLYVKETLDSTFTIIRPESLSYPHLTKATDKDLSERWSDDDTFVQAITLTVPAGHVAASGYQLVSQSTTGKTTTYRYISDQPASSIIIPVAPYKLIERKIYRVYYFDEDEAGAERVANGIDAALQFFEKAMCPLKGAKSFTLVEVPDNFGSQAIMPTIIQTAKSFKEEKSMTELYHEISHFWNVRDNDVHSPRWNEGQAMFLQHVVYDHLNERGSLLPSLELRWQSLKKQFEEHPEYSQIPMIKYGEKDLTGLSYRAGPIFFYLMSEIMGEEKLLLALGAFYSQHYASGTTSEEFADFMIRQDKRVGKLFSDWFFGAIYARQIATVKSLPELVALYR